MCVGYPNWPMCPNKKITMDDYALLDRPYRIYPSHLRNLPKKFDWVIMSTVSVWLLSILHHVMNNGMKPSLSFKYLVWWEASIIRIFIGMPLCFCLVRNKTMQNISFTIRHWTIISTWTKTCISHTCTILSFCKDAKFINRQISWRCRNKSFIF